MGLVGFHLMSSDMVSWLVYTVFQYRARQGFSFTDSLRNGATRVLWV